MKNIAIITSVSGESAKVLADALNTRSFGLCTASVHKPYKDGKTNFKGFDFVLSLGCSASTFDEGKRLNKAKAVLTCVDKPSTFQRMQHAGVSTVNFCLFKKDIPKGWDTVVIRDKVDGRKAEGLYFAHQGGGEAIRDGVLFSEYYEHKHEYRIMVFMGKVVGRYHKHAVGEDWFFNLRPAKGFEMMDDHCIRAAAALGIDYVGFDVVANDKKHFKILEANSGARITDEAETAIVEYFINL